MPRTAAAILILVAALSSALGTVLPGADDEGSLTVNKKTAAENRADDEMPANSAAKLNFPLQPWYGDYEDGRALARRTGKPLMVVFR